MKKISNEIWVHILSYLSPFIDKLMIINKGLIYNIELNLDTYIGLTNKRFLIQNLSKKIEIISYFCDIDVRNAIYSLKKNKYSLAKTIFYCGFTDNKYEDLKKIRVLLLFNPLYFSSIEEAYTDLMDFYKENEKLIKEGHPPDHFYNDNGFDKNRLKELEFNEAYDQTITGEMQIFINKINIYIFYSRTILLSMKLDKNWYRYIL